MSEKDDLRTLAVATGWQTAKAARRQVVLHRRGARLILYFTANGTLTTALKDTTPIALSLVAGILEER